MIVTLDNGLCQMMVSGANPDGTPRLGVFFKREEGGKGFVMASSNQFWAVPGDNGASWNLQNPPPTGSHPYLIVPDDASLQAVENRLVEAKNNQTRVLAEIRAAGEGGHEAGDGTTGGTVDEGGNVQGFDPADANKDGVVTDKEQAKFEKHQHGNE